MKVQIAELTILDIRILTSSQNPYGQNQYQQGPYNNQQQPYNPQYQQQPYNPQQPYAQQQGYYDAYGTWRRGVNPNTLNNASTGGGNLPNRDDDEDEEEEEEPTPRRRKTCGDYDDCKEICDDIFRGRESSKCGRLSRMMLRCRL